MVIKMCGPVNYLLHKKSRAKPLLAHVDKLRPCCDRVKGEWEETPVRSEIEEPQSHSEREGLMVRDRPRRSIQQPVRFDL